MPIDYRSWQIVVPATGSIQKQTLFKSAKPISQWTIIIQYEYTKGDPSPNPPPLTQGVLANIVGLVDGIDGIQNEISGSQTWVPLVGATYRAYGKEIQIGFNNDFASDLTMFVSAVEEAPVIMDGESRFADSGVPVMIPQFATSFSVALPCDVRQLDATLNSLLSIPALVPGQFYPIHNMAYFIDDQTPQTQVYSFRKGYT